MQTLGWVSCLHNFREFSETPSRLDEPVPANSEKVLYYLSVNSLLILTIKPTHFWLIFILEFTSLLEHTNFSTYLYSTG